jgi:hypothetical protein
MSEAGRPFKTTSKLSVVPDSLTATSPLHETTPTRVHHRPDDHPSVIAAGEPASPVAGTHTAVCEPLRTDTHAVGFLNYKVDKVGRKTVIPSVIERN